MLRARRGADLLDRERFSLRMSSRFQYCSIWSQAYYSQHWTAKSYFPDSGHKLSSKSIAIEFSTAQICLDKGLRCQHLAWRGEKMGWERFATWCCNGWPWTWRLAESAVAALFCRFQGPHEPEFLQATSCWGESSWLNHARLAASTKLLPYSRLKEARHSERNVHFLPTPWTHSKLRLSAEAPGNTKPQTNPFCECLHLAAITGQAGANRHSSTVAKLLQNWCHSC